MDDERLRRLREVGAKPVRIDSQGRVFIGDQELFHPVEQNSITVSPWHGKLNRLTLTLVVGEVTVETRDTPIEDAD